MTARWWALGTWALVAATLLYWGLRLFAPATPAPAHTQVASAAGAPRGDLTRLLGVDAAPAAPADDEEPPAEASRFMLLGVAAPRGGSVSQGVALISVDGQPAKAYRVGAPVDGDTVLHSVQLRSVTLGPRGQPGNLTLEIPPPEEAATGTLPAAVSGGAAPGPAPARPVMPGVPRAQALPGGVPPPAGVIRPFGGRPMAPGQVVNAPRAPMQAQPQPEAQNADSE